MDNYFKASDILDKAIGTDAYFPIKSILLGTKTADVVPKAAYDQVVWERDMAVLQLRADYGVGLGEKKADVAPVVRCSQCVQHEDNGYHFCNKWEHFLPDDSEFFCAFGERKEANT